MAGAVLAGAALAGCGGGGSSTDSTADYCKDLKKANKDFATISSGDIARINGAFDSLHKLAGEAPDAVKKDWKTYETALTGVQKALKSAGISTSDMSAIEQGKKPAGIDVSKVQKLAMTLASFNNAKFQTASTNISAHAKSACKIKFSG